MALELSGLLAAVSAIGSIVKETVPVVQTVRSGLLARNEPAKQQLTQKLQTLQGNLRQAGELAQVAESYSRVHENVLELLSMSRRAERFLRQNIDACRDRQNPAYAGNWMVLESLFETIDSNRDLPRMVIMARADWYDEEDKTQINLLLQQFSAAYDKASALVKSAVAHDLLRELGDMSARLQDVDTLVRDTLYGKIFRSLQRLGS